MKKVDLWPQGHILVDDEDFPKFENRTWSITNYGAIRGQVNGRPQSVIKTIFPDRNQNEKYVHLDGNKFNFQKANIGKYVPMSKKEYRDKHYQKMKRNKMGFIGTSSGTKTVAQFLNGESRFD